MREYHRFGGPAFAWDVRGRDGERDSSDFNPTVEKRRRKSRDHTNRPRHIKDGDTALVWRVVGPTRGPVECRHTSFHRQEDGLWVPVWLLCHLTALWRYSKGSRHREYGGKSMWLGLNRMVMRWATRGMGPYKSTMILAFCLKKHSLLQWRRKPRKIKNYWRNQCKFTPQKD